MKILKHIGSTLGILMVVLLFGVGDSLRMHQALDQRDASTELVELQSIQNSFVKNVTALQELATKINTKLSQSQNDPNSQISILWEGLADERDALYNI